MKHREESSSRKDYSYDLKSNSIQRSNVLQFVTAGELRSPEGRVKKHFLEQAVPRSIEKRTRTIPIITEVAQGIYDANKKSQVVYDQKGRVYQGTKGISQVQFVQQPAHYERPRQVVQYVQNQAPQNFARIEAIPSQVNNSQYIQEIERLRVLLSQKSQESESWRLKSLNYEAQIGQQGEIFKQYNYLLQENQSLKATLNDHFAQLEQWRRKCFELEGLRGLAGDKERIEQENQKLQGLLLGLQQKIQFSESEKIAVFQERGFYENELRRLSEIIDIKNRELASLVIRIQTLEFMAIQNEDLQSRIMIFGGEFERIHSILQTNLEEINRYHEVIAQLEYQLEQKADLDKICNEQQAEIKKLRFSIEDWIAKYARLELLINQGQDSEEKNALLANEIQRLNAILTTKQQEIDELKQYVNEYIPQEKYTLEQEYQQRFVQFKQEIERLKIVVQQKEELLIQHYSENYHLNALEDENIRLREILEQKLDELDKYKVNSDYDIQEKNSLLVQEIERLNLLNGQKEQEIVKWRSQYDKAQLNDQQRFVHQDIERSKALLAQEIERLQEMIRNRDDEIFNLKREIDSQSNLKRETLYINEKIQNYEKKIQSLYNEIDQLSLDLRRKDDENYQQKRKLEEFLFQMKEGEGFKTRALDYEAKLSLLSQEIERLNSMVTSKDRIIDQFRVQLAQLEGESSISQRQKNLILEYEDKLIFMQKELDQARYLHQKKDSEINDLRIQFSNLENQYSGSSRIQTERIKADLLKKEEDLTVLTSEIGRLNQLLSSKNLELTEQRRLLQTNAKSSNNFTEEKVYLLQEIDRLTRLCSEQTQERDIYLQKYNGMSGLNGKIQNLLVIVVLLCAEVENLRQKVGEKENEIVEVRRSSYRFAKQNN